MDDPTQLRCPICTTTAVADVGPISHRSPALVAGVPINLEVTAFRLACCQNCGFQFKQPPIPESWLRTCYEQASASQWGDDPNPIERQFDLLRDLISQYARGRRVLDIGCGNGAILEYLGSEWERYGVELCTESSRRAAERGVNILGETLDDLSTDQQPFDVILMIDVIEHLPNPIPTLRRARSLLTRQGILIIFTGDTEAWSWRLLGSRYWYCCLPEHVCFYSQRTFEHIAARMNWKIVHWLRLSHVRSGALRRVRKLMKNLVYALGWRCHGFGMPAWKRYLYRNGAPDWLTANDHQLVVMQAVEDRA